MNKSKMKCNKYKINKKSKIMSNKLNKPQK